MTFRQMFAYCAEFVTCTQVINGKPDDEAEIMSREMAQKAETLDLN